MWSFWEQVFKNSPVLPPALPHPSPSDHALASAPDFFPYWFGGTASCTAWQLIYLCSSPGRSCPGSRLISDRGGTVPGVGAPWALATFPPHPMVVSGLTSGPV